MRRLITHANIYILCQAAMAAAVVTYASAGRRTSEPGALLLLLCLSAAAGAVKIVIPKIEGNLSLSYVFSIWGVVHLSLGETLLISWASVVAQCYWHCKKRPTAIQLLFNLATMAVSVGAAMIAFRAGFIGSLPPHGVLRNFTVAIVYFVVNTMSVSAVIGLTERLNFLGVWRTSFAWSFPYYLLGASMVSAVDYVLKFIGIEAALLMLPVGYMIYQTLVLQMAKLNAAVERAEQEKKHSEETSDLHLRTIRALALAIEAKDQTTGEHLHRVQTYAMELAKDFRLPPAEMQALHAAAILHDVGKIAVPEAILSKPGKLTPEEFARMKLHTILGAEIAASVHFPFEVAPIIRSHHEKWNGSGYPDGLRGEEIPLGARILTAVDCLDALASDRQYRKAMPFDQAMSLIVSESGKAFDPAVVEVLRRRCHELESLARATLHPDPVRLSTNAVVERGSPDAGYAAGSQSGVDGGLAAEEVFRERPILSMITSKIGMFESLEADLLAMEEDLRSLIPFDCLALYRLRGEALENLFARGDCAESLSGLSIDAGAGISGWTVATRTPLLNGNAATEFGVTGKVQAEFGLVSGLAIPLESDCGPLGVLTLYSRRRDAFGHAHLRALLAIGSRLSYQMRLDFSGLARAGKPGEANPGAAFGKELTHLHAVIGQADGLACEGEICGISLVRREEVPVPE